MSCTKKKKKPAGKSQNHNITSKQYFTIPPIRADNFYAVQPYLKKYLYLFLVLPNQSIGHLMLLF